MSIWTKSIDSIEFADVETFCLSTPKPREGPRLDFKQAMPADIAKLISAFANTLGGMVIVGVKGDAKNEPVWPPVGLALKSGVLEQFTQAAQQAIYPPVAIETSGFLVNPTQPSTGIVVVRVHESSEAPHAVDGGRKIYERTGDVNDPINFAHVDRIERLLRRRGQIESRRLEIRERFLSRARRILPQTGAIRWLTVMPLFPSSPLAKPEKCHAFLQSRPTFGWLQRTPDGAFASSDQTSIAGIGRPRMCRSVGIFGDVCCADFCEEESQLRKNAEQLGRPSNDRFIGLKETLMNLIPTMHFGVRFLRSELGYQGYIQISTGILRCTDLHLLPLGIVRDCGRPFLDDQFVDDEVVMPASTITCDEVRPLFDRLQFAFDHPPANCDQFLKFTG